MEFEIPPVQFVHQYKCKCKQVFEISHHDYVQQEWKFKKEKDRLCVECRQKVPPVPNPAAPTPAAQVTPP